MCPGKHEQMCPLQRKVPLSHHLSEVRWAFFKEGGGAQGSWGLGRKDKLAPGRGESHGFWGLVLAPRAGSGQGVGVS